MQTFLLKNYELHDLSILLLLLLSSLLKWAAAVTKTDNGTIKAMVSILLLLQYLCLSSVVSITYIPNKIN